jgi:hypothetical protein
MGAYSGRSCSKAVPDLHRRKRACAIVRPEAGDMTGGAGAAPSLAPRLAWTLPKVRFSWSSTTVSPGWKEGDQWSSTWSYTGRLVLL